MAWASRNGVPRATSHSARSVADVVAASAAAAIRWVSNDADSIIPANAVEGEAHLVDGIEQWLLVLLEVAVVRQRESLQRRQQSREVADQSTRLSAGKLGDVRVLLLREHRRSGGVGIVEAGKPELLTGPEHEFLTDPRQVDPQQREIEQRLGNEVAVADGVERVVERLGEPEVAGSQSGIDR